MPRTVKKTTAAQASTKKPASIEDLYPYLAAWVADGWVEIGQSDFVGSFVRAFDEGGMVFEGKSRYKNLDAALKDLNDGIQRWCDENGIDLGIGEE